ncbi:peptide ABC transporter substrate-binding protein [Cytobacillus firmus]|uniref:Oligopeptide ABC transporter, substrate-binding protein OppA n=1 Tax=Cytobacillus firmus TaxID=1399 RepID=A0A380XJC6_CYTFI|nr:peptide ABC transporter substrate-binding protein [Cytobacillus firmus]KAF0823082.1 Oligopeptide ABC transporter, substrate-binding protein OppA [Cytobacillus firmus]MBG9545682.1 ABC transporter substrate-binding protein [Cytobacillus firmus]MBG9549637.1 ABC transporter substrate-binding protein [Cytobacillus firmus]MBG9556407.1 ABC transporter substrate-binding protein [Cytobacillus firmus]MBG9575926.1 ABC transporter substrate-binding protein [Cytobacillus firmus]
MNKRLSIFFSMLLVLSMFLAACSGGGDNADGGEKGGDDGGKSDVPQELRVNINTEPPSLNPGLAEDSTSGTVLRNVLEGLTRINQDGKPEKAMAEDIKVSEDGKTYTFTIRDAKWSNGDPVIAKDFEYAWKWALDPANNSTYAYQLYYLEGAEAFNTGKGEKDAVGVKAIDDKTLEVKLVNPTPYFEELTAFYTYLPVNSKIAEANPEWATDAGENFTTNGPFHLVEWAHSDKIVLEKSETYWDAETVKLDSIEMIMINDPNTELSMFDNGELDWAGAPTGALPTDAMQALKDEGRLVTQPIAGIYNYKFNTTVEPFNNVNIRKAFAHAINRQELIDNILQGEQLPAMAIVPPSMFEENEKGYFPDNDVEKAKEYLQKGLEELGYKDASELPAVTLSYNTSEAHQKIAQAIQDMWKQNLGVEVTLDNAEWNVFLDKVNQMDYQVARMGWLGDFNDAINFLEMYRDADGGNNNTGWESKEFQDLLAKSATETDPEARQQLLKDAEAIFMEDMPVAPIYFYTNNWVQAENLKDVAVSGLGDVQYKWAYFE